MSLIHLNQQLHTARVGASIGDGRMTAGAVQTLVEAGNLISLGAVKGRRQRSCILEVASDGDDNETADWECVAIVPAGPAGGTGKPDAYTKRLLCSGTLRLSATTGALSDDIIQGTDRMADSFGTVAESGYHDALEAALGAEIAAHNPEDDTPAQLVPGDLGGAMYLLFSVAALPTGATYVRALAEVLT